jgi:hypothetical protein
LEIYAILALVCFLLSISLRKYVFNKKCNYCDYIFVFTLALFIFSLFSLFAIKNIYKKELFKKKSFFDENTVLIFVSTFLLLIGLFFNTRINLKVFSGIILSAIGVIIIVKNK